MKVLLINGSPRRQGNTNVAMEEVADQLKKNGIEGETSLDVEGLQTMRTLANNMAWMLKKLHGVETADAPEREPWNPMNFIR